MKLQYFDQPAADEDDTLLKECIDSEYVPKTCLLGGVLVQAEAQQGRDPCATCRGPRDRCKGRGSLDKDSAKEKAREEAQGRGDSADARKVRRGQMISVLNATFKS